MTRSAKGSASSSLPYDAPELGLEQSNLSRHLTILEQVGVLFSWNDGLRVNFKVAHNQIFRILDIAAAIHRKDIEMRAEALQEA